MAPHHQRVARLKSIPGIGVDRMANLADGACDREILRLENLDTDLVPPAIALEVTQAGIGRDENNSYLPFLGLDILRQAAVLRVERSCGCSYDWRSECLISAGGMSGILNVLLALVEPGDEVIVTDPVYAGIINRIHLAGATPKFVSLIPSTQGWSLDLEELKKACSPRTKLVVMSPGMPSGHVLTKQEWEAVCELCVQADAWLLYDAAMERILYDGREVMHPASFPGMKERTITVGAASKELRMIGWRVGWVVAPEEIMKDIGLVSLSNVVCQVGIAMHGVAAALQAPDDGLKAALECWQERRDVLGKELEGFGVIFPHGGWSMLVDARKSHLQAQEMSDRLLKRAKIATTPMVGWGPQAAHYVRFVFSNEPKERLVGLGEKLRRALE